MKQVFKFEFHEIKITKAEADFLRERILTIAKEKNIGTIPMQFEDLIRDIKEKLIELSNIYDFVLDGKPVDFSKENFAMFTSKVLKIFFKTKLNDDIISIVKKNLDILCFYALDKPWTDVAVNNKNNKNVNFLVDNSLSFFQNKKIRRLLFGVQYIIFSLIIIYFLIENKNMANYYKIREARYQNVLKNERDYFSILYNYDLKNYDTLNIPKRLSVICEKHFSYDSSLSFPGGIIFEIIKRGEFQSQPGVKYCNKFDMENAFGFGTTKCTEFCYKSEKEVTYLDQTNTTILRIMFKDSTYISYIKFRWVEINGNWGSGGMVYVNRKMVGDYPYQYIGIYPPSNMLKDETVRNFKAKVDEVTKFVDIAIYDISNESEIFVNDICIYGK